MTGRQPAFIAQSTHPGARNRRFQPSDQSQSCVATIFDHANHRIPSHPPGPVGLGPFDVFKSGYGLCQGHQYKCGSLGRVHPDVVIFDLKTAYGPPDAVRQTFARVGGLGIRLFCWRGTRKRRHTTVAKALITNPCPYHSR